MFYLYVYPERKMYSYSNYQNRKVLEYLKKGYKLNKAAKLSGVYINTMMKIKKLGLDAK